MKVSLLEKLWTVWNPSILDSIDGRPISSSIRGLFTDFEYDRLPTNPYVAALLRPEVVLGLIVLYLVSKSPLQWAMKVTRFDSTSGAFHTFIALHNLGLAVFSWICAWNSWTAVLLHVHQFGLWSTYCDPDGRLWQNGLGVWSTIFYISKYYEFLDTWVLVLKGKDASFLQVYHHAGIVFCMWGAVASQSAWLLFVVLLNSVIHTLMYLYFFIKTISPTTEIKIAKYLTMAQITQFMVGITCTLGVLYMGDSCDSQSSRFALVCLHVYGWGLIALFMAFAKRKYKKS
ncbi:long chain acyl-coa elongase [Phaeodactylum tricornutum CCAP 1055/1]|jgi:hypothetical protein|uniref:Elongation of fatty acids protein n=2 Tax=Phaeodactylum tricornutum TaxID=2850 RepID=B7FW62_PHATC|nr:long chain acyl-coa elongase [Phaeodactylum tricornutum CCAP 1055/1]EEC49746.1 long chain acyl-coa elongase [Phaeodactylum tricornutum CCAP 1055/1]|eukprot:XP_002179048.1 long chain acyl-coa elongase [Phaeodactylum tricornutum CCAP 1055/1]